MVRLQSQSLSVLSLSFLLAGLSYPPTDRGDATRWPPAPQLTTMHFVSLAHGLDLRQYEPACNCVQKNTLPPIPVSRDCLCV